MSEGSTHDAGPARRSETADDSLRQCPTAKYTLSVAVCTERQRRKYHECNDCSWSEANQEKQKEQAQAKQYSRRYGF